VLGSLGKCSLCTFKTESSLLPPGFLPNLEAKAGVFFVVVVVFPKKYPLTIVAPFSNTTLRYHLLSTKSENWSFLL
jgi:hypothetical protein